MGSKEDPIPLKVVFTFSFKLSITMKNPAEVHQTKILSWEIMQPDCTQEKLSSPVSINWYETFLYDRWLNKEEYVVFAPLGAEINCLKWHVYNPHSTAHYPIKQSMVTSISLFLFNHLPCVRSSQFIFDINSLEIKWWCAGPL